MKFGFRRPSIAKRIAARTSLKRAVQNSLGLKAPRGMGWLTNPKKAAYNRVYNRTTRGCSVLLAMVGASLALFILILSSCGPSCPNCSPNGACVDGACICDPGFEGTDCGFLVRDRIAGAHAVNDTCTSGIRQYMVGIGGDSLDPQMVNIGNFAGQVIGVKATVNADLSIDIAQQTIQSQTATVAVSGHGTIHSDGISLHYIFSDGVTTDTCSCRTIRQE
jgi:hypothetical protein